MAGDSRANGDVRALLEKCRRLEGENQRFRDLLAENGIAVPVARPNGQPQQAQAARSTLNTAQKIALFRWLFRRREDVYAQRWESPDGRSGYSPKTERDWKAYYAAKKEDRKRVDKETRKYIPLTGEAIHAHFAGKQTLGVYPLLLDETCWFLAVDFDKKTWKDDAAAFRATCRELNLPAAVERSRSGNGGLSPQERLQFHQQHSAPVMDSLQQWMEAQFAEHLVEPNSGLGKAITYFLRHWKGLTAFLRAPGAPLDNNLCERARKHAVLHRKNALVYRTLHGAEAGDLFMSLIHTCELAGANPFD